MRLSEGLSPLLDAGPERALGVLVGRQQWFNFARSSEAAMAEGYRLAPHRFPVRLMCRSRFANGAVATGVARRSMAQGFKGDMPAIYDRLKAADCPASAAVGPRMMRELGAAADLARGQ